MSAVPGAAASFSGVAAVQVRSGSFSVHGRRRLQTSHSVGITKINVVGIAMVFDLSPDVKYLMNTLSITPNARD